MNEEHKIKMDIFNKQLEILVLQKKKLEESNVKVHNASRYGSGFGFTA